MRRRLTRIAAAVLILTLVAAVAGFFAMRRLYPKKYEDVILKYAEEYGLEPELVFAVIKCESNFDEGAVSRANAYGLMQITHETMEWAAARHGHKETGLSLTDPDTNVRYGCAILSLLKDEFSDTSVVLAAYNAGRSRVKGWLDDPELSSDGKTLGHIPYRETRGYVAKVIKAYKIYQTIY